MYRVHYFDTSEAAHDACLDDGPCIEEGDVLAILLGSVVFWRRCLARIGIQPKRLALRGKAHADRAGGQSPDPTMIPRKPARLDGRMRDGWRLGLYILPSSLRVVFLSHQSVPNYIQRILSNSM